MWVQWLVCRGCYFDEREITRKVVQHNAVTLAETPVTDASVPLKSCFPILELGFRLGFPLRQHVSGRKHEVSRHQSPGTEASTLVLELGNVGLQASQVVTRVGVRKKPGWLFRLVLIVADQRILAVAADGIERELELVRRLVGGFYTFFSFAIRPETIVITARTPATMAPVSV